MDTVDIEEQAPELDKSDEPRPKVEPILSRFLFVDVAALRAKQLRRGARPRLDDDPHSSEVHRPAPLRAERIAMEEVSRGLVPYEVTLATKDEG